MLVAGVTAIGKCVASLDKLGLSSSCMILCSVSEWAVFARINRCRSSPTLLPSSGSESEPSSKVSAKVRSASEAIGSEERRCRDEGDEARDRNEGGGEEGAGSGLRVLGEFSEASSWSLADTCTKELSASALPVMYSAFVMVWYRKRLTLSYLCELIMRLTLALRCQSVRRW